MMVLRMSIPIVLMLLFQWTDAAGTAAHHEMRQVIARSTPDKDAYALLAKQQRQTWGKRFDLGTRIKDWARAFGSLPSQLKVNVVLVGFDGQGSKNIVVSENDMLRHLRAIKSDLSSVVLQPDVAELVVRPNVSFTVLRAPESTRQRVEVALSQAAELEKRRDQHAYPINIPYYAVDDVLRTDYKIWEGAVLTIYLLNPAATHGAQYVYTYQEPGDHSDHDTSTSCHGTLWAGPKPYIWVDIAAGPVAYGPGAGHQGQVFHHSFPHLNHYKTEIVGHAVIPDLAALVWSACRHHLWPPVQHLAMSTRDNIEIMVVHMHDSLSPPPDRLDQDSISKALQSALSGVQSVSIKEAWLPFARCDLCVAAFSAAIKEQTARDDETMAIQSKKTTILDRLTLHAMLKQYVDSIFGFAGIHTEDPRSHNTHILPVLVFDVGGKADGEQALLLDGLHKAVAFSDMVIAVSSKVESTRSHFTCEFDRLKPSGLDVTREVLAALLTAGWGVPDTSTFYTDASGEGHNYLWSVGNTPFGPLSRRASLTSAQQQALHRNVGLASLNASVSRVLQLLGGYEKIAHNGQLDSRVPGMHQEVMQRLDLALFKAQEAAKLMGEWNAAQALAYIKSMQHDVKALERQARRVNKNLEVKLTCKGVTSLSALWWAPVGALAVWPLAVYVRRRVRKPKLEKLY